MEYTQSYENESFSEELGLQLADLVLVVDSAALLASRGRTDRCHLFLHWVHTH